MDRITISVSDLLRIKFTSDQHFGHRNVIQFCNRPYEDIKEMGEDMIERYNRVVSNEDYVFILGDVFWFNDSRAIKKILGRLNGKMIYIIPGNHDDFKHYYRVDDPRIVLCDSIVHLFITDEEGKRMIHRSVLSHYPLMTWSGRIDGKCLNLHGHIHSRENCGIGFDKELILWNNQYDVGVDNNDYAPISLTDIINKI